MSEEGTERDSPTEPAANTNLRWGEGFLEQLLKFRYVAVVVVVLALLHSLMFLFLGVRRSFATYWHVLGNSEEGGANTPGLELLHSLDFFLVSLVLMILGLGVAKLFLLPPTTQRPARLPTWLHVDTFSDLKYLLWETILTTLLIAALPVLAAGLYESLAWSALVIPAAILLLAFSLYFMKKA